ncbi:MAG: sigma-54-dependent Fis family transcriptional regulator [Labilithrix sp.]|nr:sigma-54-dependent Fis family transcriptional regulator [Labilithrix sp.]MCW5809704.1 sigma-54-dependent Fis family transcriptional regulator [Labilithrix sp.]
MSDGGLTLRLGGAAATSLPSELRVTVLEGRGANAATFTSNGPSLTVGRTAAADVWLDDPAVSAFHVELTSTPAGIAIKDAGSSNGTFVGGGIRVIEAVVPPGSVIVVGTTTLRVDRVDGGPRTAAPELASFGRMRASSAIMRSLFAVLARVAPTELSILIEGQTGTGKELVAEAIHHASPRAKGPFIILDCTSVPRALAESVLFGHERGAFTGADDARPGVFEAAEGGTVFIDEIGELPLDLQPKLLRVLEKREVARVGQSYARPVNVRVLAATWRDLRKMVNAGTFREDLYFRIAQARVGIPPLGERIDDIPALVYHFLQTLPPKAPGARMITREALEDLKTRPWPGNVRELRSTVERAAMLAQGAAITPADLGFERLISVERTKAASPGAAAASAAAENEDLPDFKQAKRSLVDDFERGYLASLLERSGDNLTRASAISGIERHHLRDLLRKHGLRGT